MYIYIYIDYRLPRYGHVTVNLKLQQRNIATSLPSLKQIPYDPLLPGHWNHQLSPSLSPSQSSVHTNFGLRHPRPVFVGPRSAAPQCSAADTGHMRCLHELGRQEGWQPTRNKVCCLESSQERHMATRLGGYPEGMENVQNVEVTMVLHEFGGHGLHQQ